MKGLRINDKKIALLIKSELKKKSNEHTKTTKGWVSKNLGKSFGKETN